MMFRYRVLTAQYGVFVITFLPNCRGTAKSILIIVYKMSLVVITHVMKVVFVFSIRRRYVRCMSDVGMSPQAIKAVCLVLRLRHNPNIVWNQFLASMLVC